MSAPTPGRALALRRPGLGEAGVSHDDQSYEGEQSDSFFSGDYYRSKAREFQVALNAMDDAWNAAQSALILGVDEATAEYIVAWLADFDSKRTQARMIAEGINLTASVVNSAGGRMPVLSIPGSLGAVPFLIPAAGIAAFAAVASFVAWAQIQSNGLAERLRIAYENATPEVRAQMSAEVARAEASARTIAASSGLGALAPMLKLGALALAAYLGFRALGGAKLLK